MHYMHVNYIDMRMHAHMYMHALYIFACVYIYIYIYTYMRISNMHHVYVHLRYLERSQRLSRALQCKASYREAAVDKNAIPPLRFEKVPGSKHHVPPAIQGVPVP